MNQLQFIIIYTDSSCDYVYQLSTVSQHINFSLTLCQSGPNSSTFSEELSPTSAFPGCKIHHLLPLCDHAKIRRPTALVHFHTGLHGEFYYHTLRIWPQFQAINVLTSCHLSSNNSFLQQAYRDVESSDISNVYWTVHHCNS